ncbi:MAG: phosphoribosylamine--glycine ligase [Lentimicrobium sp.]|jgi:phosphoribosylamine--glycine ligase|nr:phosphoribosylamine--glycine ligase [Lentimicrobium sp.]
MNVLILGSGGREHALAWKFSQSPLLGQLFIAPGNAGTSSIGVNVPVSINDFEGIRSFVLKKGIELVVVGPEEPLVNGIYDFFKNDPLISHIPVVGPSKIGAQLEGSKDFAKSFMLRNHIPTAAYHTFTAPEMEAAKKYLSSLKPPYVLKADGLAAGKGVIICDTLSEAVNELEEMMVKARFGKASAKVVIEEFLEGIELSVFVITDGKTWKLLPEAKDYKRIGNGDTGPNTGGMGAVSPVPFADKDFMQKVIDRIIQPTINGLKVECIDYKGFIFFGLIKVNGDPFVIEYNVRLGDPETEAILPRITNDLLEVLNSLDKGTLNNYTIQTDNRDAVTVMLVSAGYPGDYPKGLEIDLLDKVSGSLVFHAGTAMSKSADSIVTSGGRVIAVTSLANGVLQARDLVYQSAKTIDYLGKTFRTDIGLDLVS